MEIDGAEVQARVLTVTNYGEGDDGELIRTRITIPPNNIDFIVASFEANKTIDGMELYKVNVITGSGANVEVFVTFLELTMLERAAGTYFLAND
jgi:hypothetical protein